MDRKGWAELKEIALANPKGKIVPRGAKPPDIDNCGRWDGSDCSRDMVADVGYAMIRLTGRPVKLIGNVKTISRLCIMERSHIFPEWMIIAPTFSYSVMVAFDTLKFFGENPRQYLEQLPVITLTPDFKLTTEPSYYVGCDQQIPFGIVMDVILRALDFIEVDEEADDDEVILLGDDGSAVLIDTR